MPWTGNSPPLPPHHPIFNYKQPNCKDLNGRLNYCIKVWNGKFLITCPAVGQGCNKRWYFACYRTGCPLRAAVFGACPGPGELPGECYIRSLLWEHLLVFSRQNDQRGVLFAIPSLLQAVLLFSCVLLSICLNVFIDLVLCKLQQNRILLMISSQLWNISQTI